MKETKYIKNIPPVAATIPSLKNFGRFNQTRFIAINNDSNINAVRLTAFNTIPSELLSISI